MWKKRFDRDTNGSLSPYLQANSDTSLTRPIVDIARLTRATAPKVPKKPASTRPVAHNSVNVMDVLLLSPEEWNETALYLYLTNAPRKIPILCRIHEMWIRENAGHKFYCSFLNASNETCFVWVGGSLLMRYFPTQITQALAKFKNLLR